MKLTREHLTKKLINFSGFVVVLAAGGLGLLDFSPTMIAIGGWCWRW
jgi:hypothetical protein